MDQQRDPVSKEVEVNDCHSRLPSTSAKVVTSNHIEGGRERRRKGDRRQGGRVPIGLFRKGLEPILGKHFFSGNWTRLSQLSPTAMCSAMLLGFRCDCVTIKIQQLKGRWEQGLKGGQPYIPTTLCSYRRRGDGN